MWCRRLLYPAIPLLAICAAAHGSEAQEGRPSHSDAETAASPGEAAVAAPAPVATVAVDGEQPEAHTVPVPDPGPQPFAMLDAQVPPGETRRLAWVASESFSGISVPTPVLVAHGVEPGPVLCLTAAIHGDELNGIEMVRQVLYELDAEKLKGTVIGVPIVNLFGFRRSSRYLPDRRDLNRYFPGDPDGSSASRIAYAFFESIVSRCDALVDLHTGSFHRTNLSQLRADLNDPKVVELTRGFGDIAVLHSSAPQGSLRLAAARAGIPAVTLEAGEPMRFQPEVVARGVKGIRTLLHFLNMAGPVSFWGPPQPVYYESTWVRADAGGIFFSRVELGARIKAGDVLGTITDPVTNTRSEIVAPIDGRILGMALNQVVIPGFAAYRIGMEKSGEAVSQEAREAAAQRREPDAVPATPAPGPDWPMPELEIPLPTEPPQSEEHPD